MDRIFKKLESHINLGYPFVVYRKPGNKIVTGLFQKNDNAYYTKAFNEKGFVFAPFHGDKNIFIPADKSESIAENYNIDTIPDLDLQQQDILTHDKNTFENLVKSAVADINEGYFEKVVLSRKETIQTGDVNIIDIYKNLLSLYPLAFAYCFFHPETGLWMGATPEQLLKIHGNTVNTVALAGTELYNSVHEVKWQDKEKQEQQIVTDYIKESLAGYCQKISETQPYTHRAGNIVHIKTDITAELNNTATIKDIVKALHPTPAVCGMPKQQATNFIIAHENYEREYYSGFLGEINYNAIGQITNNTDLYVNLRCMKKDDKTIHIYIGCGITKDSDPEKEYIETGNKANTIKKALLPAKI